MPTPARPHLPAIVVPLSSPVSPARRRRSASAPAARRQHPSAAPSGDAVVIPFPTPTAPPGPTP
jgi:hypothetical protein